MDELVREQELAGRIKKSEEELVERLNKNIKDFLEED